MESRAEKIVLLIVSAATLLDGLLVALALFIWRVDFSLAKPFGFTAFWVTLGLGIAWVTLVARMARRDKKKTDEINNGEKHE